MSGAEVATPSVRPATTFELPPGSDAPSPPERRGLARDGVRLLAASRDAVSHHVFRDLPRLLSPGDLVVVNTSRTLAAALSGSSGGSPAPVHVSTALDDGSWVVEPRLPDGSGPDLRFRSGDVLSMPGGLEVGSASRSRGQTQRRPGCGALR